MKKTLFFALLAAVLVCGFAGCMSVAEDSCWVMFYLDGGHIDGHPGSVVAKVGYGDDMDQSRTKLPVNPQKENYVFDGWFTAKNGFGNAFTLKTRVYSNITVYAKWIPE
jgi:uncharacterized repeat protein (TIGR02543 family)